METIYFHIPGKPQGKARARTGYNAKTKQVMSHTPDNTVLYENFIKTCYMQTTDKIFDNGEALSVCITACFEPAKSVSKKMRERMLQYQAFPTKKPDIDNIVKAVLDALNGIAYKDDIQVVRVTATKIYAERAGVHVEIKEFIEGVEK